MDENDAAAAAGDDDDDDDGDDDGDDGDDDDNDDGDDDGGDDDGDDYDGGDDGGEKYNTFLMHTPASTHHHHDYNDEHGDETYIYGDDRITPASCITPSSTSW